MKSAPPPRHRLDGRPIRIALWCVLLVTNVVDYVATRHAMSHGAVELNPFVNLIFDELNMQSVAIFKLLMLLFLLLLSRHMKGWTLALFAATTAIYVLVALYHWGWHHTLAHH